jgi:multiple antibiotic resistance protein
METLDIVSRFFLIFTTLFVIVDPIGIVPTFLALTKDQDKEQLSQTIWKACLVGALTLVFFTFLGGPLFKFLNLNLNAFKVGGGLLLLLTALDMLRARNKDCRCSPTELAAGHGRDDVSVVPIAIPLLAGPGAITSVVVFSFDHTTEHALHSTLILAAITLVFLISFLVFRSAGWIGKLLGKSRISVLQRIMGLLLAALSLQLMVEGGLRLFSELT